MKMKNVIILMFSLAMLVVGCSNANDWKYTLQGKTENWEAVLEIGPSQSDSDEVVYTGKIKKANDNKIESVHYEAVIGNSNPGGNIKGVYLDKIQKNEMLSLFTGTPDFPSVKIKKGMSEQEIATIFHDVTFTISWKDNNGEHEETIPLSVVK